MAVTISDEMFEEAKRAFFLAPHELGPLRSALEAVAPLIANAQIEACAEVAKARKQLYDTLQGQNACAEIASSIRALKEK